MMTTTPDPMLAAGTDRLDAVDIGQDQYAYWADDAHAWYVVTADDVRALGRALRDDDGDADAYALWCATCGEEVSDLDHDQLDRIADATDRPVTYRCQCGRATGVRCEWTGPREELWHLRWVPDALRGSACASGTYTSGAYASSLYVTGDCADDLAHVWVDGEMTEEEDPYVRIIGPAYEAA